jgi:NADPH:quinone reductase-like Zn-dependent oxidoreductase
MSTMKAMRIHEYGDSSVLRYEDAPLPTLRDGDVLIRVHATSVNPFEWKMRAGYLKDFVPLSFPAILGWDVSGVVEAVSPGVTTCKVGDEVYALADTMRDGAYAEYIAVSASQVAPKPKSIDHIHAAAVPLASLAAWQTLFETAGLQAGQRVLVHAAAGGVGSFAAQLAKWKGAHVYGTASAHNLDFIRSLGVDEPIDYTTTKFETVARDMDVVLDTVGGDYEARSCRVLKPGGTLVSILSPTSVETAAQHGVLGFFLAAQSNPQHLTEIAALIDEGKIKPVVENVFPLQETGRAHNLSAGGHVRGKIALQVTK